MKKLGLQLEDSPQVCLTLQLQEFPSLPFTQETMCRYVHMHVSAYGGCARGCMHVSGHVCSGTAARSRVRALPTVGPACTSLSRVGGAGILGSLSAAARRVLSTLARGGSGAV